MSEPLDRAVEALRAAPIPAGPPPELVAATVAAVAERAKPIHAERRKRIMRIAGYGTAGALAAGVLVAAGVLWVGGNAAQAVEDAAKLAANATSVKVTNHYGPANARLKTVIYLSGDRIRQEADGVVHVVGGREGRLLRLDATDRTASIQPLTTEQIKAFKQHSTSALDPLTWTRMDSYSVRELPREPVGDRPARVYQLTPKAGRANDLPIRFWVDAETGFPIRSRVQAVGAESSTVIEFSDWNAKFDPKLFALDPPAGFTVIDADKPADDTPKGKGEMYVVLRRAADNAEKADSCRIEARAEAGGKVVRAWKIVRLGERIRSESEDGTITVTDNRTNSTLRLDAKTKQATQYVFAPQKRDALAVAVLSGRLTALVAEVGQGDKDAVRVLGPENVNGRPTTAYQLTTPNSGFTPGRVWTVWVDPKTELPVRMRFSYPGDPEVNTLEFVAWGEKMDPELFSLKVPEGYQVEKPK